MPVHSKFNETDSVLKSCSYHKIMVKKAPSEKRDFLVKYYKFYIAACAC